jgi:hypothetical protein
MFFNISTILRFWSGPESGKFVPEIVRHRRKSGNSPGSITTEPHLESGSLKQFYFFTFCVQFEVSLLSQLGYEITLQILGHLLIIKKACFSRNTFGNRNFVNANLFFFFLFQVIFFLLSFYFLISNPHSRWNKYWQRDKLECVEITHTNL